MSIYTKSGDDGSTSLYSGQRVLKSAPRVDAYGSIDELSSWLGIVITKADNVNDKSFLTKIQKNLYEIMAVLAGKSVDLNSLNRQVKNIEQNIDRISTKLDKLNGFILPQGSETGAFLHVARTVCRRAERSVVCYLKNAKDVEQPNKLSIVQYLNRLSDLLFVMSRSYSEKEILV